MIITRAACPMDTRSNWTKGKGKFHHITGHEGPEGEQRYSSNHSLTLALDGVGGQLHAPASLPPGKTRYTLYGRLGKPQGRSGRVLKISSPPEFDHRTDQLVVSRNTDWDIPAPEVTEQLVVSR